MNKTKFVKLSKSVSTPKAFTKWVRMVTNKKKQKDEGYLD